MLNSWLMQDQHTLTVWLFILMNASHKDHTTMVNGAPVILHPGDMIFGRAMAAKALKTTERKIRTSIARLEHTSMITRKPASTSTKSASLLSVIKWAAYQIEDKQSDQENVQEATKRRPRGDQEATTIQEGKEGKEGKEKDIKKNGLDYSSWPSLPSQQVMADWLTLRKRLKADVTQTVINRLGPKLTAAMDQGYSVDDCIGACIEHNWKGFDVSWIEKMKGSGNQGKSGAQQWLEEQESQSARV